MNQITPTAPDAYLAAQTAPQQAIKLDKTDKFTGIRMITPIGRLSFVNIVEAKAVNQDDEGKPGAKKFSLQIVLNPASCGDIWKAVCMVANDRWPAEQVPNPQTGEMTQINGEQMLRMGLLHSPLRNGDQQYMKKPTTYGIYRGQFFINAGTGEKYQPVVYDQNGQPANPASIYSGCYGRLWITIQAFWPKPGQQGARGKGVTAYLNGVQFARHGDKLSGFDALGAGAAAFAAAPLPEDPGMFGMNTAGAVPGGAAPAAAPGGFAAPQPGAPAGFAAPAGGVPAGAPNWGTPGVGGGAAFPG